MTDTTTEMRALEPATAWLIERRGFDTLASPNTYAVHWYAQDEATGWHWWTPVAVDAKRFVSKAEAEAFPPYQMIARDPSISITEHVFLSASPKAQGDVTGLAIAERAYKRLMEDGFIERAKGAELVCELLEAALPPGEGAVAEPVARWTPINDEARSGKRILLLWRPVSGLPEHVELGWWKTSAGKWTNTYGKPFSDDPDAWAALAPFVACDHTSMAAHLAKINAGREIVERDSDGAVFVSRDVAVEAMQALYASPSINPVPAGVGVKELVWHEYSGAHDYGSGSWEANGVHGIYAILDVGADYNKNGARYYLRGIKQFDTLDEAKAAAQADYEQRILSTLEPSSGEPSRDAATAMADAVTVFKHSGGDVEACRNAIRAYAASAAFAAQSEIEGLREALRPFAKVADDYIEHGMDHDESVMSGRIPRGDEKPPIVTFADFRLARALSAKGE